MSDKMAKHVEELQMELYNLRGLYRDNTLAFSALLLAYEATRLAWYAIKRDSDGGHLENLEDALRWYKAKL